MRALFKVLFCLLPISGFSQEVILGVDLGTSTPVPTINRTPSSLSSFTGTAGSSGSVDSASVSGTNLLANISVSGTTSWEVSLSRSSGYTGSVTLTQSGGSVVSTWVYYRFKATATEGDKNEGSNLTSSGASPKVITLTGTVSAAGGGGITAKFSLSKTSKTCSGWTNIFGEPNLNVLTGTDVGSGVTFTSVATANWTPNGSSGFDGNGTQSGTFFNDCSGTSNAVMYNGWVNGALYNHSKPQIQLGGLNPSKTYTIALTGCTQGGTLRTTDVQVEGASLSSILFFNAKSNIANGATFNGIAPDGSGNIKIFISAHSVSPEQGHVDAFTITSEN